jgi:hypothetical protein
VASVVAAGQLAIRYSYTTIDFSVASFGASLLQGAYNPYYRFLTPSSDSKGCGVITVPKHTTTEGFVLVLERGECSFYTKGLNAQKAGASAVLIYNSLEGIYAGEAASSSSDYECDNGAAWVPASDVAGLTADNVYGSQMTAAIPASCGSDSNCDSGVCLYTNTTSSGGDRQACCAWDLYLSMGSADAGENQLSVVVGFLTMGDYTELSSHNSFKLNVMDAMIYEKLTLFNFAAMLVWAIAVFTVIYGSIQAAEEDKMFIHTGRRGGQDLEGDKCSSKVDMGDDDEESVSSTPSLRRVRRDKNYNRSSDNKRGLRAKASAATGNGSRVNERTGLLAAANNDSDDDGDSNGEGYDDGNGMNGRGANVGNGDEHGTGSSSSSSSSSRGGFWAWLPSLLDNSGESNNNINSSSSSEYRPELAMDGAAADDDRTINTAHTGASARSAMSEFFLRVKGHVVHSSEYEVNDEDGAMGLEIGPQQAIFFVLLCSVVLVMLYYVDLYTYYTLFYLAAAVFALHSVVIEPLLDNARAKVYKYLFLYDYRNQLGPDCAQFWSDCCTCSVLRFSFFSCL